MPPIVKDSETPAATPISAGPGTTAAKPRNESPSRPRPVALEIPVTVNGARTVEGSDKREPFSESTTTVLVFSQGAVIRLAIPLATGQLIFLTNEKSKKEVVCQVVKSKNCQSVTGYVELEFTEPAVGFWGLRFPSDQLAHAGSVSAPAPAAPPAVVPTVPVPPKAATRPLVTPPVAAKPAAPVSPAPAVPASVKAVVAPPPPAPRPAVPVSPAPVSVVAPPPPPAPARPEAVATKLASLPGPLPDYSAAISALFDSPGVSEAKPAVKEAPKVEAAPAPGELSTEELKLHAARLQEQLNSLLFTQTPAKPAAVAAPAGIAKTDAPLPEMAEKPRQVAQAGPKPAAPPESKPVAAAHNVVPPSLAAEKIKVPAWLAPLARESESGTAGLAAVAELPALSDALPPAPSASADSFTVGGMESQQRQHSSTFGGHLLGESKATAPAVASHSKKILFIGIAAALLLAAGVVWYTRQPANLISRVFASKPTPAANIAPAAVSASTPQPAVPAAGISKSASVPASSPAVRGVSPANATATLAPATPAAAKNPKKSAVGQIHLATPVINRAGGSQAGNESEPSIDVNQAPGVDPLAGLTVGHRKEPAAPLAVGGNIKQARLLKSVAPSYPPAARAQNISGDVNVDALIDATGAVSTVKVISGPVLLHQAAMDAVRQWKYEPAQLNGKATTVHITVTVHFRSQ